MRKIIIYMLSLVMVFAPAVSFAASPVGWVTSPADIIIGAAGNTVTAIKGAGSSALQSTIKYAPTAANVGKKILKGAGAGAVLMAVTQILGKSVDYVLDPANNRIKYMDTPSPESGAYKFNINGRMFETMEQACQWRVNYSNAVGNTSDYSRVAGDYIDGDKFFCAHSYRNSGKYFYDGSLILNPDYEPEEKYIPISQVASKVASNAAAGHAPSQELIKTVIIDDVNAGVLDVPFNTNAIPKVDNPPVTDPNNPPVTDPNNPPVPFDPSSIIAAIKSVMAAVVNMSGVLGAKIDALMIDLGLKHDEKLSADAANTGLIVDAIKSGDAGAAADKVIAADKVAADKVAAEKAAADEYFKDTPPESSPDPVVVDTLPPTKSASEFDINYINFGGQCPVLPSFNIGIGGASSALTFDMTPLCDMAVKIRPAVIAIAYFIGLGVIASAIRET